MTRRHFHTFDALRFFSFLIVFLHHSVPKSSFLHFFAKSGGIGVTFFFVLSGFLITYILGFEKKASNRINLKKFFIRRVLRIWPLFYAMLLFAFLTPYILDYVNISYSNEGYEPNWFMSLAFAENYKIMLTDSFPNVSPLRVMWSLCIEEHFYVIWGVILYFISLKRIPKLIIYSLLIASITRWIYNFYDINTLDILSNIDYFAFGAIPAYLILTENIILEKVEKIPIQIKHIFLIFSIATVFILPSIHFYLQYLVEPIILGLLFATIILITLTKSNSLYINEKYLISKLGKYTYGLYIFHTIVINLLLQIKRMLPFQINWLVISIIALLITTFISMVSYHYFEKYFLQFKKHFY